MQFGSQPEVLLVTFQQNGITVKQQFFVTDKECDQILLDTQAVFSSIALFPPAQCPSM